MLNLQLKYISQWTGNSLVNMLIRINMHVCAVHIQGHKIRIHIEGPLASEPLKFLKPRMSHYARY